MSQKLSALFIVALLLITSISIPFNFAAADDDKNKNKKPLTLTQLCSNLDGKDDFKSLVCTAVLGISNSIQNLQVQINNIQQNPGPQGPPGTNGKDGSNGNTSLISTLPLSSGDPNCPAGGFQVLSGIDINNNGILEPTEVTHSNYVCNGAQGPSGIINAQTCLPNQYVSGISPAGTLICTPLPNTGNTGGTGSSSQIIYVSTLLGNDQYSGTMQFPMKTITAGIQKALSKGYTNVYVDQGTYDEQVTFQNGISIYGGFDSMNSWAHPTGLVTKITNSLVDTNNHVIGVSGSNINSPTVLDDVTISLSSVTTTGVSNYGLYCNVCPSLTLSNDVVLSGNAGTGTTGINGLPGPPGGSGLPGGNGGNGGDSIGAYLIDSTGITLTSDQITSGSGGNGGNGGFGGPSGPIGPGGIIGTQGQGGNGGNGGSSYSIYGSSTTVSTTGDILVAGSLGNPGTPGFGNPSGVSGLLGQAAATKFV